MENANSSEYLEKIKIQVIENLKKTAPVPSVQMQDVPRQGLGMSDGQEDELNDADEDENKDVRMTQRQWEQKVHRQDEFEDSDDEDMAQANGVYKTNGQGRLNIMDFQNPNPADDEMEVDSGLATPAGQADEAAVDNDETMIDETQAQGGAEAEAEVVVERALSAAPAAVPDAAKVDGDGDVDMGDSEAKTAGAAIKTEEVDGASAPGLDNNKTSSAAVVAEAAVAQAVAGSAKQPSAEAGATGTAVAESAGKVDAEDDKKAEPTTGVEAQSKGDEPQAK